MNAMAGASEQAEIREVRIEASWKEELKNEFAKSYFTELREFVRNEYRSRVCYPPSHLIFSAFDHCPFSDVRVVILGQDPYHGPGQANGICFSVTDGVAIPPSLRNIFKELSTDLGQAIPNNGNLLRWANQGVLMLNATLTVRAGEAGSHQGRGWERFTDEVILALNNRREKLVFILWGAYAQRKGSAIDQNRHLVLRAPHPSPLSAHNGYFGCRHFSLANDYLKKQGLAEVRW